MEKTKSNKNTIRAGLIFVVVWLLVGVLVMTVAAATSGNGSTSNNEFSWSWRTENKNSQAAGTFTGNVANGSEGQKILTLNISASSSIKIDEKKDSCGNVTQQAANALPTTNTATVTNNTGSAIRIIEIDADKATYAIPDNRILANGDSFTVSVTANPTSNADTTSRQNSDSVTITFESVQNVNLVYYGADSASYTYNDVLLDDATDQVTTGVPVGSSITLPDAPTVTSGTFAGWRVGHIGSLFAPGSEAPITNHSSIYPVITTDGQVEPFTVGGETYKFWTDAAAAAGTSGLIILNQNYSLPTTLVENGVSPAGSKYITGTDGNINFIIPQGVTLLIPYNSENTLCTTKPTITTTNATTSPSAFQKLLLKAGTHITVNGAISVAGQQYCSRPIGAVSGKYGAIEMEYGSSITVNNGAFLYAWGYIAGVKGSDNSISEGTVTIKSGGTVYEDFQVVDWRGGNATTSMLDNESKVFPASQYYVQNVQVPMTLETGATEITFTSVKISIGETQEVPVNFIGSSGMFVLGNDTSVIKDYNEATDRLTLEIVKGRVDLGRIVLKLKLTGLEFLGTPQIKSENYVLPLNSNITIIANSNTSLTASDDVAMLPGSKIILEKDSQCNINGGNFYVYDLDQWSYDPATIPEITASNGKNGGYCSEFNWLVGAVPYAHNRLYTRTVKDLEDAEIVVDGNIIVDSDAFIYATSSGANIRSTGTGTIEFKGTAGTSTVTHQAVATKDDRTGVKYVDISITPIVLQNADGTDVVTGSKGVYTYGAATGKWCPPGHQYGDGVVTEPTCIEDGYTTYTCAACGYVKVEAVAALGHTEVTDAAVLATCTATGLTEGKHCSVCNTILVAQQVTDMIPHTPGPDATCTTPQSCTVCGTKLTDTVAHKYNLVNTVEPSCDVAGQKTYSCALCGDSYTETVSATGHTQVEIEAIPPTFYKSGWTSGYKCGICGTVLAAPVEISKLAMNGVNISVTDCLDIHFYIADSTLETIHRYYTGDVRAEIDFNGKTDILQEADWDSDTNGDVICKEFICTGIAAKQMADAVTIRLYAGEELLYTVENYSIQAYAMNLLAGIPGKTKLATALVDMLNYGASAQNHFGYNTANFANSQLTETQAGWATGEVSPTMPEDNGDLYAASVSAWNNLMYTFYFDLNQYTQEQIGSAKVSVTYKHYTGNDGSFEFEKFHEYGSRPLYGVDVRGIFFADGKQTMTCTLEIGGDTLTATDSIEGYIARAMSVAGNDDPVYSNLMRFIMSTNEYFSKAE